VGKIIADLPFHSHVSLEYFPHAFPQSSIIARFEPFNKSADMPLTVIGAHQDSANYNFPLLPAPGADDDCSGTVSILEAFRVLANSGFTPLNGPVEFHWYAAEEAGLLGSQAIARYRAEQGVKVGGMLQLDMTAFIAKNATEKIAVLQTGDLQPLVNWTLGLSKEYIPLETKLSKLST
jgi:bacterial leucyl aminopeptidase